MEKLASFFIIVPPSFEELALLELQEKWAIYFKDSNLNYELKIGGIELTTTLECGFYLNYILKIPSKILLRIEEFKCKDGPKLYNKIAKIKWSQYLIGEKFEVSSESINSRLFDDRKINKATTDAIHLFLASNPLKKKYIELHERLRFPHQIQLRIENDVCTVSINITGELLYKRGDKLLTGNAPIRENLAAALFYFMKAKSKKDVIKTVADPMCGSGTLLKESYQFYTVTKNRDFAFLYLPLYLELKNKNIFNEISTHPIHSIWGFDLDQKVILQAKDNCKEIEHSHFFVKDLFKPNELLQKVDFVLTNPPYGIRVSSNHQINSLFFTKALTAIQDNFSPELVGIIVPSEYQLNIPKDLNLIDKLKFKNGGINVTFYILSSSK